MNAPMGKLSGKLDLMGCQHWSTDLPYRAIIAVREHIPHGTILYQVAGAPDNPCGALKALKLALNIHGGTCFYCKTAPAQETSIDLTIDHIVAKYSGGKNDLTNLVVACRACNIEKGQGPIDAFNPRATKEWLNALKQQIDIRLKHLND
jgi:5-methylcytosine-specific restriction endonuclease McrA